MNKYVLLAALLVWHPEISSADIQLTDEQFSNMDIVQKELKAKDANFVGLNGSKESMSVIGMSDKEALKVIQKIDFTKKRKEIDDADPVKTARKSAKQKIQTVVSLTDAEFKALFGGD